MLLYWATVCPGWENTSWLPWSGSRRQWEMDAQPASCRSPKGRPAPRRSGRITIRCRRVALPPPVKPSPKGEQAVVTDFPAILPVLRDEVAILRAYLGKEIDAILFGEE